MKLNRLTAVLLLCMLCFSLAGCAKQDEYPKTIVDGDYRYEISLVKPLPAEQIEPAMASLIPAAGFYFNDCIGIIAKGRISNMREIEIKTEPVAAQKVASPHNEPLYVTLFDFSIEECYFSSRDVGEVPKTISVYYGYSSHFMPYSEFPNRYVLEEGKDYYLLIQTAENRTAEFQKKRERFPRFAELTEGQSMPEECHVADYFVFCPAHMLLNESSPADMIKYEILDAFDNDHNSNAATKAFIEAGDFSIAAYEEFLKEYGRILSEQSPAPEDVTPVPEDATPVPEDMTPVPEDATPVPEDATPVPEDMTPAPEDMTPAPEDTTPAPDDDASKRQDG